MEITVTCRPWSLKITILGTKRVSRKMGAYQLVLKAIRSPFFSFNKAMSRMVQINYTRFGPEELKCIQQINN